MPSNIGRLFFPLLLTVLLAVAVACGTTETAGPLGSPQAIIGSAPDITLGQAPATVVIDSPHAKATGTVDLTTHSAQLRVQINGEPDASVLIVNGAGFVKTSPTASWSKLPGVLPLSALVNPSLASSQAGSEDVLPSSDPWADIDLIRGTSHILSDGGGEVQGVSTIGYTLTVDPAKAIAATPADRQPALRALLAGRSNPFMIGVAIDSAYRIRQIEVGASMSFTGETPPTRVDGETIGSDVDFVSFGAALPPLTVPQT
ncbi:MAG: hypothetical protein ACRDZ8_13605 [Acidimicrobiales bacterium]